MFASSTVCSRQQCHVCFVACSFIRLLQVSFLHMTRSQRSRASPLACHAPCTHCCDILDRCGAGSTVQQAVLASFMQTLLMLRLWHPACSACCSPYTACGSSTDLTEPASGETEPALLVITSCKLLWLLFLTGQHTCKAD